MMSRSKKNEFQSSNNSKCIQRAMKRKGSLHESILDNASSSRRPLTTERENLSKTLKRFNRSG